MGFLGKSAKDWGNEGIMLGASGRFLEAIRCFDKALELDPKYTKAWCNKGVILLQAIGKEKEANHCFKSALDLDPTLTEAWYNRGNCLQELGRNQDAITCYEMIEKIDPNGDIVNYALKQKNLSQMVLDSELPTEFSSLFFRGLRLRDSGKNQEAVSYLKKSIKLVPLENEELISSIQTIIYQLTLDNSNDMGIEEDKETAYYCDECGNEVNEDDKFCSKCNTELEEAEKETEEDDDGFTLRRI